MLQRTQQLLASTALSAALLTSAVLPSQAAGPTLSANDPVFDGASVLSTGTEERLRKELNQLTEATGWKLKVLTKYQDSPYPTGDEVRKTWGIDKDTIVVISDPSAPNILRFQIGDAVYEKNALDNFFFTELSGRFGNKFNVRDYGEESAIVNATEALATCLQKEGGCRAVPGLSEEQFQACVACSIAGGIVLGFSTKAKDLGPLAPLYFSPVWGILYVSFGLGPIVSRTDDKFPVGVSTGAFLLAAAVVIFAANILGVKQEQQQGGPGGSSS